MTAARRRIFIDGHVALSPAEEDGSLSIPVDSIVEAVQSLGSQKLNEALENLKRIAEAQRRKLGQMIDEFQAEPDDARAHRQWKEIEKTVFGVEYPD